MTARRAFINARLIDPATGLDAPGALLIENGAIADFGPRLFNDAKPAHVEIVDCGGAALAPGLVDMRVFVGEPGEEHRETLKSASDAAAAGGVTTMIVMPETTPVIDDAALADFIARRAQAEAKVRVRPMAAITRSLKGQAMTEMGLLAEAGAVAFSDGNRAVANAQVMRRALTYAANFGLLVEAFPAEPALTAGGQMNAGELATRLGLAGIPVEAEIIMVERDLRLAALTGARVHIGPISCAASLEAIMRAKAQGLRVTCSTSAAHIALNENDITPYLTFRKLLPVLRGESDRIAMAEGVARGDIDALVSGHDPQPAETKRLPFAQAAFGGTGLETLLAAALSLHHDGGASLGATLRAVTEAPARLLGLDAGRLAKGAPADLVLVDVNRPWVVSADAMRSRSKNTPFDGRRMQGRALRTIVGGHDIFVEG